MINARSSLPEIHIALEDGSEIGLFSDGMGPMNMVLLHGLNSYSGTWKKNVGFLSKYGRLRAPTLPRVDIANVPPREFIASLSGTVLALMNAENFGRATLFGNSMGGWICMFLAIHYPERVNGVVLVDTAGVSGSASFADHPSEVLGRAHEISQPALIVWGEEDEVLPVGLGRTLHEKIGHSRLEIVKGAGHIPHLQKPDVFNGIVASFFTDNEGELSKV